MSKFLRQMTALSKKPSDFKAESVPPTESVPHLVTIPPPISTPPTVPIPPTDSLTEQRIHRPKPRLARLAQDGHSHAEQAVYAALWDAGTPDPEGNRIVTMGLGRLSKAARLSENNCRLNIRTLVKKLALVEIGAEDSRASIGKTYRVYSYSAILSRRRAAGMEWIIRTKGVVFVAQNGTDLSVPDTVSVSPTDSTPGVETEGDTKSISGRGAESVGDPPTDSISPFRNSFRNNTKETSSSLPDATILIERLSTHGIHLDDDAGRRIVTRCQNTDHTATVEEIATFAELKVRQLEKRRDIENWPGLLMAAVPTYFGPPATELTKYRAGKRREREEQERLAQQVIEDPHATPEEKEWARSMLLADNAGST